MCKIQHVNCKAMSSERITKIGREEFWKCRVTDQQPCSSWGVFGVTRGGGSVVTLVPGVKTGRFLSAKCSVTLSQLWKAHMEINMTTRKPRVPLRTLLCRAATQAQQEQGEHSPALVHVDLLLDQLSVGALRFLLRHCHQLDQFRPESQQHTLSKQFCKLTHKTTQQN